MAYDMRFILDADETKEKPANTRLRTRNSSITPSNFDFLAPQQLAGNLAIQRLLADSSGAEIDYHSQPQGDAQFGTQLDSIQVHQDLHAQLAALRLGAHAFALGDHIFLGPTVNTALGPRREEALRHELVHVAQARLGRARGHYAATSAVEQEARQISEGRTDAKIKHAANPSVVYGLWWVIPLAAGLYVLLRPNVANAPSSEDVATGRLQSSVSELQVAGEALALFAVPTGVAGALGRMGFGVISSFALSGAAASVSYRGVQDAGAGKFSGVEAYVVDATTGLVIGAVVGGVLRPFVNVANAARPNPSLIHLTDPAGQAGIQASGVLRGSQGIYAIPASAANEGAALRFLRTLVPLSRTRQVVPIPGSASGLFTRPLPVGAVSLYQRLMGVYRAPAGSINLLTGEFTASGNALANITGQFWPHGIDGLIWASASVMGSALSPMQPGANERGIPLYRPVHDLIGNQSPLSMNERHDGPFIFVNFPVGDMPVQGVSLSASTPNASQDSQVNLRPLMPVPAVIFVTPLMPESLNIQTGSEQQTSAQP